MGGPGGGVGVGVAVVVIVVVGIASVVDVSVCVAADVMRVGFVMVVAVGDGTDEEESCTHHPEASCIASFVKTTLPKSTLNERHQTDNHFTVETFASGGTSTII